MPFCCMLREACAHSCRVAQVDIGGGQWRDVIFDAEIRRRCPVSCVCEQTKPGIWDTPNQALTGNVQLRLLGKLRYADKTEGLLRFQFEREDTREFIPALIILRAAGNFSQLARSHDVTGINARGR
jgi:hypothetical protein